jgi:hypothetical protein
VLIRVDVVDGLAYGRAKACQKGPVHRSQKPVHTRLRISTPRRYSSWLTRSPSELQKARKVRDSLPAVAFSAPPEAHPPRRTEVIWEGVMSGDSSEPDFGVRAITLVE